MSKHYEIWGLTKLPEDVIIDLDFSPYFFKDVQYRIQGSAQKTLNKDYRNIATGNYVNLGNLSKSLEDALYCRSDRKNGYQYDPFLVSFDNKNRISINTRLNRDPVIITTIHPSYIEENTLIGEIRSLKTQKTKPGQRINKHINREEGVKDFNKLVDEIERRKNPHLQYQGPTKRIYEDEIIDMLSI